MERKAVLNNKAMGFVRDTLDPFLFCVHHLDHYPVGNEAMGPDEPLIGRHIGSDFDESNEWKMYHGRVVPGFPAHPHRGFETITIVLKGFVDHFDSGGSTGRYGFGDVQWMTAGSGLMHSEMFPLVNMKEDNTLDLFQIWLNLPAKNKFADPGYEMIWANDVAPHDIPGGTVRVISGTWNELESPPPPEASWAHDPNNEVGIYIVSIAPRETVTIPRTNEDVNRMLYHVDGGDAMIEDQTLFSRHGMELNSTIETQLSAGDETVRVLILQGKPIDEPVVQHGPFVMNSREEIIQAFTDFQRTEFGGWSWGSSDVVHPRDQQRFAKMANGDTFYPS